MNLVSLITLQCPLHLSMFSLLSTISSSLSAAAANCWEDILDWKLNRLTESRKVLINKILGIRHFTFSRIIKPTSMQIISFITIAPF